MSYQFFNCDCVEGAKEHLEDDSVDLMICDPPYGIQAEKIHAVYNRDEKLVIDGYVEIDASEYLDFSRHWIEQAARVLKPGGSIYIFSGYTNLLKILRALEETELKELNHIVWKYNFGVYTKNKFVSSHFHILLYVKPGAKHTFNTFARYSDSEKTRIGNSENYQDRQDVWVVNREYKPGKRKHKNQIPEKLLIKMIQYSSNPGDLICDFFLGSFATAKVAKGLGRQVVGFELAKEPFEYQSSEFADLPEGYLTNSLREPPPNILFNQGKRLTEEEKHNIVTRYTKLRELGQTKTIAIGVTSREYGRGYWSIRRILSSYSI